jgi:hypothetical protein
VPTSLLAILSPMRAPASTQKRTIRDTRILLEAMLSRRTARTGFDGSAVAD